MRYIASGLMTWLMAIIIMVSAYSPAIFLKISGSFRYLAALIKGRRSPYVYVTAYLLRDLPSTMGAMYLDFCLILYVSLS
jgi:hypothetical protein